MRTLRHGLLVAFSMLGWFAGCSGSEFSSNPSTGGSAGTGGSGGNAGVGASGGNAGSGGSVPDSSTGGTSTGGTSTGGTSGASGGAAGDAASDAGCVAVGADATDVWVDKQFSGPNRTGSQACPLQTITEAMAVPHNQGVLRTVHVAGKSGGLEYDESTRILVNHDTTLQGDGPALVTIKTAGDCAGVTCAVHVLARGKLDGFTVTCPSGNGIIIGASTVVAETPVVKNVAALSSLLNGIKTLGPAELGPSITANSNGAQGLEAQGGKVHVASGTPANDFSSNAFNGINVSNGAVLVFDGGTAQSNGFNGLRLDQTLSNPLATHEVDNLQASNNNDGIAVYGGSLKLRNSKLLQNKLSGLYFSYVGAATLVIGISNNAGQNSFGGAPKNNAKSGVFLCNSPEAGGQPADGDFWSACPPSAQQVASCSAQPGSYVDVAYFPTGATGNPITASNCSVGP